MAPSVPATPASRSSKAAPKTAPTRTTRQRAAKDDAATPGVGGRSGLLAKSKEGLRKVSDKIKDKEKEKEREDGQKQAGTADQYGESLQVGQHGQPTDNWLIGYRLSCASDRRPRTPSRIIDHTWRYRTTRM